MWISGVIVLNNKTHIAIDGPAGSGKSTVAKQLAKRLDMLYVDTGAMYRAITYKVINSGISVKDEKIILEIARAADVVFKDTGIYLDGKDVTKEIRSPLVDQWVSQISKIPGVRKLMAGVQRKMAENHNVVMDGRDIGTVVLPDAKFKFYLTASIDERAKRRYKDLKQNNSRTNLEQVKTEIERRDLLDSEREHAPLKTADDAVVIDTTGKGVEAVLKEIMDVMGGKGDVL